MESSELQIFKNNLLGEIKGFVDNNGDPWFLAAQVCKCLGIKNSSKAVSDVSTRIKIANEVLKTSITSSESGLRPKKIQIKNGNYKSIATIIPENYLYELIFTSRKQKAIAFRTWVTSEILPSLRKWGEYRMGTKRLFRSMTDEIKEKDPPVENTKRNPYADYALLVSQSCNLQGISRNTMSNEQLEKIAMCEQAVAFLLKQGKTRQEIANAIL